MSVIGKMQVNAAETFDKGQKVSLGVVCEDKFMAHYHPENENVVFTRYSPSGDGSLHLDQPVDFPKVPASYQNGDQTVHYEKPCELYLIYLKQPERPNLDGSIFHARLRVSSVTLFGGDSKQIKLCNAYGPGASGEYARQPGEARLINLTLGIDNPRAADQFEPGTEGWWVVAYRADQLAMDDALALAHARS